MYSPLGCLALYSLYVGQVHNAAISLTFRVIDTYTYIWPSRLFSVMYSVCEQVHITEF